MAFNESLSKSQKKLLMEYVFNVLLSALGKTLFIVWLIYLFYYAPGHDDPQSASQKTLVVPAVIFYFLTVMLKDWILLPRIILDLFVQSIVARPINNLMIYKTEQFVLTARKRYSKLTTSRFCSKNDTPRWKREWNVLRLGVATLINAIYLDERICDTRTIERILRNAKRGQAYYYIASRYAGIIFSVYSIGQAAERWSIRGQWDG